jgi:S-DNA-T family DNA segregation ATPase FtsK/SpoIIIE
MIRSISVTIFPRGTAAFFRRRATEGLGLGLFAGAAALALALLSYAPADPSFNHATDVEPANALGAAGAYGADLTLQLFGVAACVPVLGLVAWAWLLICKRPPRRLWLNGLALALATGFLAVGLAALPVHADWPLAASSGGAVGRLVLAGVAGVLGGPPALTPALVALGATAAGLVLLPFGFGLPLSDWQALCREMARTGRTLAGTAGGAWTTVRDCRALLARARSAVSLSGPGAAPEPADGAPEVPTGSGAAAPLVAPKPTRVRTGRKAQEQAQASFDFEQAPAYQAPPLDMLKAMGLTPVVETVNRGALEQNARLLKTVLDDFGVRGEIVKVRPGPVITLYELEPAPGTKSARVIGLADDIARSMSAISARVAVIPGRNAIGIELPNQVRETVGLRELLASDPFERSSGSLMLALGKDIAGAPILVDLARMPHLLIAGTTGSGKSVAINAMILSLLYRLSPERCKLILIDPKMLELSVYDGIPHLISPVVTDPGKAVVALKWTVREMEERYRAMSQLGVRNIAGYNARIGEAQRKAETLVRRVQTGFDDEGKPVFEEQALDLEPLPLIVVVVDEMADLMLVAGKDLEAAVQRLSQMARAAGIHLIMATQRPSVDVITGTIKANFPTRISFQVTSKIDSRTILGEQGAEQLLGQGDMLFMATGGRVTRVHGPFVSDDEVEGIVQWLKSQGEPRYIAEVTECLEDDSLEAGAGDDQDEDADDLYAEAVAIVSREGKASTSFVQRRLQIGYNRAARLIERMETEGLVSKPDRVGRREVFVGDRDR